jgi:glucose-1-phosphate cytidylyltransferase
MIRYYTHEGALVSFIRKDVIEEGYMKVGILAGGLGTRLSEETTLKPKPMVEIGGKPMLWHILKIYASFGFNEFVIALGYKGELIKDYFINYHLRSRSLTIQLARGEVIVHDGDREDWVVHLLDTGMQTNTGGRVRRIAQFIGNEPFMLTYGDGVSNIDLQKLLAFHQNHGKLATVTAVRPAARFGAISFDGDRVSQFWEKNQVSEGWVNGGFFVLEPGILDYTLDDSTAWETESMDKLAAQQQLMAYRHDDFWQCMDTLRDVHLLESLWNAGNAPWKVWQ